MLADFGVNILVVKDYSENENLIKSHFTKLFGFKLLVGLVLLGLAVGISYYLPYTHQVKQGIIFASILILLFSLQNSFLAIFQSNLEYWKSAVTNVLTGLSTFLFVYVYISVSNDLNLKDVVSLTVLGYLLGLVASVFLTRRQVAFDLKALFDFGFSKSLFKRSFFIGLTIVLNSFMFSGDKFLLSLFRNDIDVGVYSLAYKLFELYLVVPTFIMNAYYPSLVKLSVSGYIAVFKKIKKIVIYMIPVGLVSSLLIWGTGSIFIPFIWGSEMFAAVHPFTILILTSLPFFITAPLTWIYYIENYHKRLLLIYLSGFVLNLVLNLKFIPIYGYIGASYITGLTELLVLVLLLVGLRNLKRI